MSCSAASRARSAPGVTEVNAAARASSPSLLERFATLVQAPAGAGQLAPVGHRLGEHDLARRLASKRLRERDQPLRAGGAEGSDEQRAKPVGRGASWSGAGRVLRSE